MLTEKDYCNYETCVALRELGFTLDMTKKVYERNLMTNRYETTPKPLLYEAQKWLREAHNLHIEITYSPSCWTGKIYDLKKWDYIKGFTFFESFEDTFHTLIKEAVKILKEK